MLFSSFINSPLKCLFMILFLIGATYVCYLWSAKLNETNNPVFVINYASIDNPFNEVYLGNFLFVCIILPVTIIINYNSIFCPCSFLLIFVSVM